MMQANRSFLVLAILAFFLAISGCGRKNPGTPTPSWTGTEDPGPTKANTKPEALTRANYFRLDNDFPEADLVGTFGPPQQVEMESKDVRKYIWISGKTKLTVHVKDGKVVGSWYPGEHEERGKRNKAHQAALATVTTLREYVLKNKNRFPPRLEDLDLKLLAGNADAMAALKNGDVVVPWGKSANRLIWAYWKDSPQFGGPYVRFDGKDFHKCSPQEFARLDAIVLTADTIPADIVATSKPGPGEPTLLVGQEKKGIGAQGFFTAGNLMHLLVSKPGSLDEVAKHMVRNYWHVQALRALEKGDLIVRWGRDPKQGVYAYPRYFPSAGDPAGWAIYKGQWAPFERIEDAKKAFAE